MKLVFRTIFGLGFGWLGARVLAILARLQGAPHMARKTQRRTFVRNAALGAVGVVTAQIAAGFGILLWPNKTGAFGSVLSVRAEDVPEVNGEPFRNIAGKFFLVHNDDGLMALYTKCPHLGCTVPWVGPSDSPRAFQCPCHGSMYNYNGVLTAGPAPRPMDMMKVTVDGDAVMVDTGDIALREEYDPEQAVPYRA